MEKCKNIDFITLYGNYYNVFEIIKGEMLLLPYYKTNYSNTNFVDSTLIDATINTTSGNYVVTYNYAKDNPTIVSPHKRFTLNILCTN